MPSALIAIDQGTTSTRAIVFDAGLNPLGLSQRELHQISPAPGQVEHDGEAYDRLRIPSYIEYSGGSIAGAALHSFVFINLDSIRASLARFSLRHTGVKS